MSPPVRRLSAADRLIARADLVLRAATRTGLRSRRAYPAAEAAEDRLSSAEKRHAAGLMRVNHAGEVCAQALYVGQGLVARSAGVAAHLEQASREEGDHLLWCEQRLAELDAHPSHLGPLWFTGALMTGIGAALAGDAFSLGFVEETEHQVVAHLEGHLEALPAADVRSRQVVRAMREDEARHAADAAAHGATPLPRILRKVMSLQARIMTTLAYRF